MYIGVYEGIQGYIGVYKGIHGYLRQIIKYTINIHKNKGYMKYLPCFVKMTADQVLFFY